MFLKEGYGNCGCNLLLLALFLTKSSRKGQIQFRRLISFLFFSKLLKNSNRQPFPRFVSLHNLHNSTDPSLKPMPSCSGIHTSMRLHSGWTEIQNFSLCKKKKYASCRNPFPVVYNCIQQWNMLFLLH